MSDEAKRWPWYYDAINHPSGFSYQASEDFMLDHVGDMLALQRRLNALESRLAEVTRERESAQALASQMNYERNEFHRLYDAQFDRADAAESRLAEAIAALEEIGAYPQDVPLFDEDARRLIGLAVAALARLEAQSGATATEGRR